MPKGSQDRLWGRYRWKPGQSFRTLMKTIIADNTQHISNAIARLKSDHFRRQVRKLRPGAVALPDISTVIPKRSVFIRKAQERGELLSKTLRDTLTRDLRSSLEEFKTKTGLPSYVKRRGEEKGRIDERVVRDFRRRITRTFNRYTVVDPETGAAPDVHRIAITEVRSTINDVKDQYFGRMIAENEGMRVTKTWRHNPHLSRVEPRPGHAKMHGRSVPFGKAFRVPIYEKRKGSWVRIGWRNMQHPHDPAAEPEDVINCHCDIDYTAEVPARKEVKKDYDPNQPRDEEGKWKPQGRGASATVAERPVGEGRSKGRRVHTRTDLTGGRGSGDDLKLQERFNKRSGLSGDTLRAVYRHQDGTAVLELDPKRGAEHYAQTLARLRAENPMGIQVSLKSPDEYREMRLFESEDGEAVLAVNGRDIVSVCARKVEGRPSPMPAMIRSAIEEGARTADCYGTYLPRYYAQFGLQPVARLEWNQEVWDQYAQSEQENFGPEALDNTKLFSRWKDGRPDYYFLAYTGSEEMMDLERVPAVSEWDEGVQAQAKMTHD